MVQTGYAQILRAMAKAVRRPPTRAEYHDRLQTLIEFVARATMPYKFPVNSKKKWRGSLDPASNDEGLSTDNPELESIEAFVRKKTMKRYVKRQLRIMILETLIYRIMRKKYEVVVEEKFPGPTKQYYRKWAGSTVAPEYIDISTRKHNFAESWLQYDQHPELIVVKPELHRPLMPPQQRELYPEMLKNWWNKGHIEAQIIDREGTRTRCQIWQLTRKLGSHSNDPTYSRVWSLALEAERLKATLCLATIVQNIDELQAEVAEALFSAKKAAAYRASKAARTEASHALKTTPIDAQARLKLDSEREKDQEHESAAGSRQPYLL